MDKNMNCKINNRIYDPDISSIITIVLGAFGAIGGIVATIDLIDRKNNIRKEQFKKDERREYVVISIMNSIKDLSLSANRIRRRLEFLESIYRRASKNENTDTRKALFGNNPILLNEFEFRIYQTEQRSILDEIVEIHKTVSIIEELVSDNSYLFKNEKYLSNINLKHTLSSTVMDSNELMQDFGRINVEEFLHRTIRICQNIEEANHYYQ